MSFSPKIYTQEINWLRGLKQDLKLKLSSTLSSTELEMPKSDLSLEEAQVMVQSLNNDFYEIHLLLTVYENGLVELLGEAISEDSMVVDLESDQNMLH